jgi:hypothetical protein
MFQFSSAIDTNIQISTYAGHDISIDFLTSSPLKLIKTMKMPSGTGEKSFVYSSTEAKFNMNVFILNNGQVIMNSRFDDNSAGESIHIILFPNNKTILRGVEPPPANTTNPIQNQSQNNSVQNQSNPQNNSQNNTGGGGSSFVWKTYYYYIIGAILLAIIVFFLIRTFKDKISFRKKDVKVRKLSEVADYKESDYKKIAERAEKKVEEMQKEINRLRNEDKIKQIETRIRQEHDEIRRLRRGD